MKLISKVTVIYRIADDFCKEYKLELNKKALSLSNLSPNIIETINDMLKNVAQIVHTRHRSISNFIVNLLAGMAAYAFYDTKPSINMEFEMEGEAEVKQLTLF
ncbi:transposase [Alloprevotella sp. Lung230]|uniref:transposase n=1 Tax=Alloprevotella sp. Lung230 TaxID=2766595 RepID=UPI001CA3990C|nr:transposase [Alloprevotella sp. Lung230]